MNGFTATGPAPSQTDLEMREGQRLAAERQARLYGRSPNTNPGTIVPLQRPSNDNDDAPKKPNGHFDADAARTYARPQEETNTAAKEAARRLNGHAQAPSSSTAPGPAETKYDTQPPQERLVATPAHDKAMAGRFLAGLDPTATKFTFQFFADSGDSHPQVFHGTLEEVWSKVLMFNAPQRGAGAYVTINETDLKGRKAENIVRVRALFCRRGW